jgi:hypothetical protein
MREESSNQGEERRAFPVSAKEIAAVLVIVFLLVQGYLAIRDRGLEASINNHAAFAQPAFPLEFSRKKDFDPLSFLGRGQQAGLWDWTPDGLELTQEGKNYFDQSGDRFISRGTAGQRRVARLSNISTQNGRREITFFYEWTEVTPPASALLFPAPRTGTEYLGRAVLEQEEGDWKVTSFETQDFEEPLARLQDIAAGVLR